jgi:hypothetical protein
MRRFIVVLCAVLVGVVGLAGSAAANPANHGVDSPRVVDGFGPVTDDWGDHFGDLGNSLCNGCADSFNTDTVMMWQAILVAEGFLDVSQIDGQFGPITANATWQWQNRYQIGRDGQVGNQTWTRADDLLVTTEIAFRHYVIYDAPGAGSVGFYRGNESLTNLDGGAYQLVYVDTHSQRWYFRDSFMIQHFRKTITFP